MIIIRTHMFNIGITIISIITLSLILAYFICYSFVGYIILNNYFESHNLSVCINYIINGNQR